MFSHNLNAVQISIIEGVINYPLNDIIQTFIANPELAIKALTAVLEGVKENDIMSLTPALDTIDQLRKLATHEYPQNRNEFKSNFPEINGYCVFSLDFDFIKSINGISFNDFLKIFDRTKDKNSIVLASVELLNGRFFSAEDCVEMQFNYARPLAIIVKEKKGLLALTSREDAETPPVQKEDVRSFIKQRINTIITQFHYLKNKHDLQKLIAANEEFIQMLLQSCDTLSLDKFLEIHEEGLKKLLRHPPLQIAKLFDVAHMSVLSFLKLSDVTRLECIEHIVQLIQLTEAGISCNEVLTFPKTMRALFYQYAVEIANLMKAKHITFDEIMENINNFNEYIENKIQILKSPKSQANKGHALRYPQFQPSETDVAQLNAHLARIVPNPVNQSTTLTSQIEPVSPPRAVPVGRNQATPSIVSSSTATDDREQTQREIQSVLNTYQRMHQNLSSRWPRYNWQSAPINEPITPAPISQGVRTSTTNHSNTRPTDNMHSMHLHFINTGAPQRRLYELPVETMRPDGMWWLGNAVVALPNGRIVITSNGNPFHNNETGGWIQILNPETGQTIDRIDQQSHPLPSLTLLPNNQIAGCGRYSPHIYIYDLSSKEIVGTISHQYSNVHHLYSLGNQLIVFSRIDSEREVGIYDIDTGELIKTINSNLVQHDEMLLTGNNIVLVGSDNQRNGWCQLISLSTGEKLREIKLKHTYSQAIALLPNDCLAVSSVNKKIYIYDLNAASQDACVLEFDTFDMNVHHSLAMSKNGHLLVGDGVGNVQEYNYNTGQRLQAFHCKDGGFIAPALALEILFERLTSLPQPEIEMNNRMRL